MTSICSFIFYSHALLCNILTTILRPNFEKPLRNAKDIAENNVQLFDMPGFGYLEEILESSPDPYMQVCELAVSCFKINHPCLKGYY